jgi:hypothetical protein
MSSLNHCISAVISRGELWAPGFATEPYEAGWAREAVIFLHTLDKSEQGGVASVQISPDGILWVDEGTRIELPHEPGRVIFAKVSHFGQFLRVATNKVDKYQPRRILATVNLK